MAYPHVSAVHLIVGGEIPTKHGPKPLPSGDVERSIEKRLRFARLKGKQSLRHVREPELVALERLGQIFEMVGRQWLTEQGCHFSPFRNLLFETTKNGEPMREVREVDGIVLNKRGEVKLLVEIRLSTQGMHAVGTKRRQLSEALHIARVRWPKAKGLLMFIRVGNHVLPEERLVRSQPGWLFERHRFCLDRLPGAWRQMETPMIAMPFNPFWDYAVRNGWELNPELRTLANAYALKRYWRRRKNYEERLHQLDQVELDVAAPGAHEISVQGFEAHG